jgi:hypothetical protein
VYSLRRSSPQSGPFTVPIQGRNTDTRIVLSTDGARPLYLTGYTWEGTQHTRVPRR